MKLTFKHGVHPKGYKELSQQCMIENAPISKNLYFAMSQHIGSPAIPAVAEGDKVCVGTMIGSAGGGLSVPVFSSVSGTVKSITKRMNVSGRLSEFVEIENDGEYKTKYFKPLSKDASCQEILNRIQEAGIVGLGGAGFSTAVKLKPKDKVDTLIINAAECEPYITCDSRIMSEQPEKFLRGVEYLARCLNVSSVMIGIEDNKMFCVDALQKVGDSYSNFEICVCPTKYPQGSEKHLIYALTKRKVPCGGLPSQVGCVVCNTATAYAVAEAVEDGKPLFERVLTVTGNGCKNPKNLLVKNGTPIRELIEFCGVKVDESMLAEQSSVVNNVASELGTIVSRIDDLKKEIKSKDGNIAGDGKTPQERNELSQRLKIAKIECREKKLELRKSKKKFDGMKAESVAKIISGGPMMGMSLVNADVATTKTTSCVLLMSHGECKRADTTPCIRCSKCVMKCPMQLFPNAIARCASAGDFEASKAAGAMDCILCGSCAFVCPAQIPLVETIAYAKKEIRERKI